MNCYLKRYLPLMFLSVALAACTTTAPNKNDASDPAALDSPASDTVADTPALDAYHWKLSNAVNSQGGRIDALFVRDDSPVQLDFKENRMNVSNTCNVMMGGYTIEDNQITLASMASTMKACLDQKLMALESEVSNRLNGVLTFAVRVGDPPELTLTTSDGDRLVFIGEPTAATRYGTDGETAFLEIASATEPCSHPSIPIAQCLQVREVYYDANGLKSREPGEWQDFYQQIDGYTHQPGIRNVVRTKRYRIANPPADAPNVAYELDMVIESEQVNP